MTTQASADLTQDAKTAQPQAIQLQQNVRKNARPRVLMVSWEYPPHVVGGLGKHVMELVPALLAQGVDVELFTPRFRGGASLETVVGTSPDGIEPGMATVHRIDPPAISLADFFTTAWQTNLKMQEAIFKCISDAQIQDKAFDVIHVHDWLAAFAGAATKQHFQIPLVSTIHATERGRGRGHLAGDLQRAINNVEWFLTYESWRIIVCSEYMRNEVMQYFDTPFDKIDVIPNGLDTARFDALDGVDLSAFRQNYATPDEKIVLYVGRVVEEKGLRVLVEAAPAIIAALNNSVKFVIVGSGPQLEDFRALAQSTGVGEKFYFTGFVADDVRDKLFKIADVAVFPSLYEPFGIVALEAMGAKVPVVTTDIGGLSEVVINYETGLKIYANNPDSLAWGVLETLQHPDLAQERIEKAYRNVRDVFNWRRIALETINFYERVLREQKSSGWGTVTFPV